MMNPSDLNDPAKAEAFVREAIDDLAAQIARLETAAYEKIQKYRERMPDHPEALAKLTHSVQEELHWQTEPLRKHRDALVQAIVRVEATRLRPIIVPLSDIGPTIRGDR